MSRRLCTLALLGLYALLSACNSYGITTTAMGSEAQARAQATLRGPGGYALRPNDKIRVKVFNEPEITGEYLVDASGYVSVPLAGRVRAAGATAGQLERTLMSRLNDGIINNPKVNVEIVSYSPLYIHGEVKRAGEFPYRPGLTVMDAIASAGGLTYRADEAKVYVRRAGSAAEEAYPMNAPVPVYPGDNVRVPERFF
jgi:protein involved in polysaccharide export with SLBB domain